MSDIRAYLSVSGHPGVQLVPGVDTCVYQKLDMVMREEMISWYLGGWTTSLLRRLQAQTLPDATPPLGKIPPFTKIAVTFEPMKQFRCS